MTSKEDLGIPEGTGSGFKNWYLSSWKIFLALGVIISGLVSTAIFLTRVVNIGELAGKGILYMGTPLPFQIIPLQPEMLANAVVQTIAVNAIFLDHIWMQLYLLGFSLIKAGIGVGLYVSIKKQRAARTAALRASGFTGPLPKEPLFARAAPWVLVAGTDVQIINFLIFTLWWAFNGAKMLSLQMNGLTQTPEYLSALTLESSLYTGTLTGEFAGASLALTGVALLAATFVMFAKAEGNLLPSILGKVSKGSINPSLHGYIPKGILAYTWILLGVGLFGLVVLAPTRIYAAVQQFSIQGAGGMGTPEWVSAMLLGVQVQSLAVPISFIGVGGPIFAAAFFFGHYIRHTNKNGFHNDESTKSSFTQSSVGTIVIILGALSFLVLVWNGILGIMRLAPITASVKAMLGGAQMTDPAFLGPFGAQMATFTQIMMTNLTFGMGVSSLLVAISIAAVISYMRLSTKHLQSVMSGTQATKSDNGAVSGLSLARWKPLAILLIGAPFLAFGTFPGISMLTAAMRGFFMNLVMTMTSGTPTPELMPALANLNMMMVVGLTLPMIGVFFMLTGLLVYTRHFIGITEERRKIITDSFKTKSKE